MADKGHNKDGLSHIPLGLPRMLCPHCRQPAKIRNSSEVTELFRDIYYNCRNTYCGFTWKMSLSFVHGISPSAAPQPGLDLPMTEVAPPKLPAPKVKDDRQQKLAI